MGAVGLRLPSCCGSPICTAGPVYLPKNRIGSTVGDDSQQFIWYQQRIRNESWLFPIKYKAKQWYDTLCQPFHNLALRCHMRERDYTKDNWPNLSPPIKTHLKLQSLPKGLEAQFWFSSIKLSNLEIARNIGNIVKRKHGYFSFSSLLWWPISINWSQLGLYGWGVLQQKK